MKTAWSLDGPAVVVALPEDTLEFRSTAVDRPPSADPCLTVAGSVQDERIIVPVPLVPFVPPLSPSRAVAKAQRKVAELAGAADAWLTVEKSRDGVRPHVELHKRGTRRLRRAMEKLERVKRAAGRA